MKNIISTLIFCILSSLSLDAATHWEQKIDSLLYELKQSNTSGTVQVKILNELAKAYMANTEYDKSRFYAKEALKISKKLLHKKGETEAQLYLGAYYKSMNHYDSAEFYLSNAMKFFEKDNNVEKIAECLLHESDLLKKKGDYDISLKKSLEGLKLAKNISNESLIIRFHYNIGKVYLGVKNVDQAYSTFQNLLEMIEKSDKSFFKKDIYVRTLIALGSACTDLGRANKDKNMYDKALKHYMKADSINENRKLRGIIYGSIGRNYIAKRELDKSLQYYLKALPIAREFNDKSGENIYLSGIAGSYMYMGNLDKAEAYADSCLSLAEEIGSLPSIQSYNHLLSIIYLRKSEYKKAFQHCRAYSELSDSIFNENKMKQIAEMHAKYEAEKKEQQIKILEKDRQINVLRRNALAGGFVLFLSLGFLIFNRQRLKINKNKEILAQERELYTKRVHLNKCKLQNTKKELLLKKGELRNYLDGLIRQNQLINDLKEKLHAAGDKYDDEIENINQMLKLKILTDEDWKKFKTLFDEVYSDFFTKIKINFPNITPAEKRLSALLKLNMNTKEIATMVGISQDSVRVTRKRLRKKFNLNPSQKLEKFIAEI